MAAAVVLAVAVPLSGCGGGSSDQEASEPSGASEPSSSAPTSSSPKSPSASSTTKPAAAAVITITDFTYDVPDSVPAGATVTVRNEDSTAHTVTADGKGSFDVTIDPGGEATFTAPQSPGDYPFVCSFHANMSGTLVVGS